MRGTGRLQSFYMFFYVLHQIFEQCKEDNLGGFLGAISPELFLDALPMDRAILTDWMEFNDAETVSKGNIIKRTFDFLNYYEERFGDNFSQTKTELMNNMGNKEIVDKAYELSQLMYEKYEKFSSAS